MGKDKRPEERFGLADKLAQPRERQLDQRMMGAAAINYPQVILHANASRSAPRRHLPASRDA
jgi:hypothetical protein